MAKHVCLLLCSIILNIVFSGLYLNVKWGEVSSLSTQLSWSREAAIEAEEVAAISCSGHGRAFLDGLVVDGKPVCECYSCYTAPDCSLLSLPCVADVDDGNPMYMEPYWMSKKESSGVLVSGWHRMGYTYIPVDDDGRKLSTELEKYIRKVHELVGNAETEGRHVVFGTGSTQLLNAAVNALSSNSSSPAFVVASIPFYPVYKSQTELFQSRAYEFKGDTSLWKNKTSNENVTFIEFVTSPNNPGGQFKESVLTGPSVKTIHDRVYYWPHYTAITTPAAEDLMLFSISKLTGHAGSRFGWALVKDEVVHQKMDSYVMHNTIGVSHDTKLRVLKLLKAIVDEGGREIFESGHKIMKERWEGLTTILSYSSRFSLQHIPPQFCSFYQRVREPSPAYAWLKCEREEDEDCYQVLKEAGILGRRGRLFEAEDRYVRLSLLKSQEDFDSFVQLRNIGFC
ncbi:tryptophan aminotransferase-related protein 4-like [Chenopodium quinoa]|uniref:tryptophan aminotransferase-related protein 4-like n=1 Tax=Chenopodium quinoa TaxID=63459 RepID=UPI000B79708E|nr:tryptophan aminotransferase-related protein 4-like [Chenopodium quinoa]